MTFVFSYSAFLLCEEKYLSCEEIPEESCTCGYYLCKYLVKMRLVCKPYLKQLCYANCHAQSHKSYGCKANEFHEFVLHFGIAEYPECAYDIVHYESGYK